MEQKESEVEAAIGRSDVQGGDSPREGGLPATRTQENLQVRENERERVSDRVSEIVIQRVCD